MVKLSLSKNLIQHTNLILTIFTIIFVFLINLNINKNLKLTFLFFALIICIYDLKYLVPFIVSLLIVISYNLKNKSQNIKEHFKDNALEIDIENFVTDIRKVPFFSEESESNLKSLYINKDPSKRYTPKDLYLSLGMEDLDDRVNRTGYAPKLDKLNDSFKKKIGLLFTFSEKPDYTNFLYKISKQLGFLEIYIDTYAPMRPKLNEPNQPDKNNRKLYEKYLKEKDLYFKKLQKIDKTYNMVSKHYEKIKLNLIEAILILFINNSKGSTINDIIDTRINFKTDRNFNYDLFNYDFDLDEVVLNSDDINKDDFFSKINIIINTDFNIYRSNFLLTDFKKKDNTIDKKLETYYKKVNNITSNKEIRFIESQSKTIGGLDRLVLQININDSKRDGIRKPKDILIQYKSDIISVIKKFDLFYSTLRSISNRDLRKETELKLYSNIFTFIFLGNKILNELFETVILQKKNKKWTAEKITFGNFFEKHDKIKNLKDDYEKIDYLEVEDIYFNSLFNYVNIIYGNLENDPPNLYISDLLYKVDYVEAPSPAANEISEIWKEDPELKKFYEDDKLDESEKKLEKYYRAMNIEPNNLKEITKQTNIIEETKNKKSFDSIIDNFSEQIFEIIEEISDLITEILQYESNSPSGSYENQGIDLYLSIANKLIEIFTKNDRIIYSGFIFILVAFFIYFIDTTS